MKKKRTPKKFVAYCMLEINHNKRLNNKYSQNGKSSVDLLYNQLVLLEICELINFYPIITNNQAVNTDEFLGTTIAFYLKERHDRIEGANAELKIFTYIQTEFYKYIEENRNIKEKITLDELYEDLENFFNYISSEFIKQQNDRKEFRKNLKSYIYYINTEFERMVKECEFVYNHLGDDGSYYEDIINGISDEEEYDEDLEADEETEEYDEDLEADEETEEYDEDLEADEETEEYDEDLEDSEENDPYKDLDLKKLFIKDNTNKYKSEKKLIEDLKRKEIKLDYMYRADGLNIARLTKPFIIFWINLVYIIPIIICIYLAIKTSYYVSLIVIPLYFFAIVPRKINPLVSLFAIVVSILLLIDFNNIESLSDIFLFDIVVGLTISRLIFIVWLGYVKKVSKTSFINNIDLFYKFWFSGKVAIKYNAENVAFYTRSDSNVKI